MTKIDIKRTPIDEIDEFEKWGDTFTRLGYNKRKDIFLYLRTNKEGYRLCWEIVKPVIRGGVRCYPSTTDFGISGKCVPAVAAMQAKMEELFQNGW